jgi:hypothetical protein
MRWYPAFAGMILAGCALGADPEPLAPRDAANVPDVVALAPRIQNTFKSVQLAGYPRVSPARKAPVSALGDWVVCLTSDADSDRIYALLIQNNEIVDYRLALMVDGCASERFEPLPGPKSVIPDTKRDDRGRRSTARSSPPKN